MAGWRLPSDCDFIIYIGGCPANCFQRCHPAHTPYATAAGASVDAVPAAEPELAEMLLRKVRDHFARLEKPVPP